MKKLTLYCPAEGPAVPCDPLSRTWLRTHNDFARFVAHHVYEAVLAARGSWMDASMARLRIIREHATEEESL